MYDIANKEGKMKLSL